jgi:hypothetical protein
MNYKIQGLSIHAEVHGTAEPVLVLMSLCGWGKRLQVLQRGWRDKEELPKGGAEALPHFFVNGIHSPERRPSTI